MRSNEVFATMSPEFALSLLEELAGNDPGTAAAVLNAIASAFKFRPRFLRSQTRAKQAEWMRKVMGRHASAVAAEEILASYFLQGHRDLLVEFLDGLGVEHEEGQLMQADPPCPAADRLRTFVEKFTDGESPQRRRLLVEAFAAQSAIDWPDLEALLPAARGG